MLDMTEASMLKQNLHDGLCLVAEMEHPHDQAEVVKSVLLMAANVFGRFERTLPDHAWFIEAVKDASNMTALDDKVFRASMKDLIDRACTRIADATVRLPDEAEQG